MATALGLHIGRRIQLAREEAGLQTQQALADLLPSPINNQYISKWEGGVKPKDPTLKLIADAVGKDVGWFYEGFAKNGGTPDPFGTPGAGGDGMQAQIVGLRQDVADLREQLGQLVGLLTGDPEKTAILSDALVRALERALSLRAREAGRPNRPPRQPPPEEDEQSAA